LIRGLSQEEERDQRQRGIGFFLISHESGTSLSGGEKRLWERDGLWREKQERRRSGTIDILKVDLSDVAELGKLVLDHQGDLLDVDHTRGSG